LIELKKYKSIILGSEILSSIGLVEDHNSSRLKLFCLHGSSCSHAESQGQIIEVEDANGSVLRDIFSHPRNVGLDDMISIQVGHFSVTLDPDLMPAIFGQVVKTSDVEPKLPALRELAYQQSCGEEFFLGNVGGHVGNERIDEVDTIFNEPKDRFLR
jgi:hypothetical protein